MSPKTHNIMRSLLLLSLSNIIALFAEIPFVVFSWTFLGSFALGPFHLFYLLLCLKIPLCKLPELIFIIYLFYRIMIIKLRH